MYISTLSQNIVVSVMFCLSLVMALFVKEVALDISPRSSQHVVYQDAVQFVLSILLCDQSHDGKGTRINIFDIFANIEENPCQGSITLHKKPLSKDHLSQISREFSKTECPFQSLFTESKATILRNISTFLRWPCFRWNPELLSNALPAHHILQDVKRIPPVSKDYMFPTDQLLVSAPYIYNKTWRPHFSRHNMSVLDFFKHIKCTAHSDGCVLSTASYQSLTPKESLKSFQSSKSSMHNNLTSFHRDYKLMYSASIDEIGPLMHDVPFSQAVPCAFEQEGHFEIRPYVWISESGTKTSSHYDYFDSIYMQIYGTKTVWLAPPRVLGKLHLQSALHPAHRSLQNQLSTLYILQQTNNKSSAYDKILSSSDRDWLASNQFRHVYDSKQHCEPEQLDGDVTQSLFE